MKAGSRPQYYRIRRMVQMVREGAETGYLPSSSDFIKEFEVSRRTVARDLDFLRDEERAPLVLRRRPARFPAHGRNLHVATGADQPPAIMEYSRGTPTMMVIACLCNVSRIASDEIFGQMTMVAPTERGANIVPISGKM